MRPSKVTVTVGVIVLMVIGTVVSTLFVRRSVHQEQRRVRAAVARWYGVKAEVHVVSCRVLPAPNSELNKKVPRARYDCVVVTRCRQLRRFAVPVQAGGTPEDAVGAPLGPPRPRSCA